ncbi:hypothetical protein O3G_MSEX014047 [Manduca sexta]|uniref:Uncharacterized protein n=1 Tax=Manduca sexta TaxID=7130 RepID=A0A921ZVH3_MANSE|nr:hypothetical protein O3G_MSEX014047 [Manduca sexta]
MQRWNPLNANEKFISKSPATLDLALAKPEDEQQFYTASVHFLTERLRERSQSPRTKSNEKSQSCCCLTGVPFATLQTRLDKKNPLNIVPDSESIAPSLSMHQILPFPKSNRDSFFTRLRNTFRKYRRTANISESNVPDESDTSKYISNFKFPWCERVGRSHHSSDLLRISEENSAENMKVNMKRVESTSMSDELHKIPTNTSYTQIASFV